MIRSPYDSIGRRALPHDPPHFIGTSGAIFFITICCQPKGTNQLCRSEIAKILFDAARFYYERHYWGLPILLLMPDHLPVLASFGPDEHQLFIQAGIEGLRDILDLDLDAFRARIVRAARELDLDAPTPLTMEGWWDQARTLEDE